MGLHSRIWALVAVAALAAACARREAPLVFKDAPVVLVSIDTLRSDRLPAYGYRGLETPNLERLRREGVLFRSAWSPCPMTLPAHLSMLTGLLPPGHGVRSNVGFVFDGRAHSSLPGWLRAKGYATGAAVSSYVLRGETGLGPLFDEYEDALDPRQGGAFADQQRPGGVTLRPALRFLRAHAGRPFFYFLHFYEPHVPYEPPEPWKSRYADPYDGEIAAADALVGELLVELETLGLYDRALIVVTSDHGEGLGDHGEDQHSILLYREAIQVPLIVRLPGGRLAGTTLGGVAQLADLAPTLLALLGLDTPPGLDGRALLPHEAASAAPRIAYSETLYPRLQLGWSDLRSATDGRWHYIHGPRPELYDLAADAGETRDLSAAQPGQAARLRAELERVPEGPQAPAQVDPETAERLAALGYVGTPRARPDGAPLPNPRDALPSLGQLREAFRLAAERRPDEAAALLRALLARQPALVEGWVKLGDVSLEAGRPADAAQAYERALGETPVPLPDVALALGQARLRLGQLHEAERQARGAEAALPGRAAELLARIALARSEWHEAERQARLAAAARSDRPGAQVLVADVLLRAGNADAALRTLDEAERRAAALEIAVPRGLLALRADAFARLGRVQQAEQAYRRATELQPDDLLAWANLAALLYAQGRRAEVAPLLEELQRQNPGPRAARVAAAACDAFGEKRLAAEWRRRAAAPAAK